MTMTMTIKTKIVYFDTISQEQKKNNMCQGDDPLGKIF